MCVAWINGDWSSDVCSRDPGFDAAGYTITQCKCSVLAVAFATAYHWGVKETSADVTLNATAATDLKPQATTTDSGRPFLRNDEIVLLVIFVVVAVVASVFLLLRLRYNRRKQFMVSTTEQELIAWNMERGNDLAKVRSIICSTVAPMVC